jgi:hypothetical protein
MGFFQDLLGGSQRKDMANAKAQADGFLQQGYDGAMGSYQAGQARFDPYAQSGQKANSMYENALGLNGVEAQQSFGQNYAVSDPFRQQNADFANNALMRQYNARGMSNSGAANLGVARASLERGSQDYQQYLTRLQGQGQQGFQATAAQGQFDQGMGDLKFNYGNARAGNAINYGNALAQGRTNGVNNILNGAGTLFGSAFKAFAPGSPSGFGGK